MIYSFADKWLKTAPRCMQRGLSVKQFPHNLDYAKQRQTAFIYLFSKAFSYLK